MGVDSSQGMAKKKTANWSRSYINGLPNSSFAVIEPAYSEGKTSDVTARHLPFKDKDGNVNLSQLRDALSRVEELAATTDSITDKELVEMARTKLKKVAKRYLKTSKFAKTSSEEKTGDIVQLRRSDYNQLVKDSERAEELDNTVKLTVMEKRVAQIDGYKKDGKSTPAMAKIEAKFVKTLTESQMAIYGQLKREQPKVVKFNDGQVSQESKDPDEKSGSDGDSDKAANDFIKRTNPALPDSVKEKEKEGSE